MKRLPVPAFFCRRSILAPQRADWNFRAWQALLHRQQPSIDGCRGDLTANANLAVST